MPRGEGTTAEGLAENRETQVSRSGINPLIAIFEAANTGRHKSTLLD